MDLTFVIKQRQECILLKKRILKRTWLGFCDPAVITSVSALSDHKSFF